MGTLFKKGLLLFFIVCIGYTSAQEDNSFFIYKNTSIETADYQIYIEDAVSKSEYIKFKVRITNKTNDYLIYQPSEVIFNVGSQKLTSDDRQFMIAPGKEEWRIINVIGKGLLEPKYYIDINILKISISQATLVTAENFYIPTKINSFKIGDFECRVDRLDIKKKKSRLKFICLYKGEGIGIVETNKCTAVFPKGDKVQNKWDRVFLFEKDKWDAFIVDVYDVPNGCNMEESFSIAWNDTFKKSKALPTIGCKIIMEIDKAKTSDKNQ